MSSASRRPPGSAKKPGRDTALAVANRALALAGRLAAAREVKYFQYANDTTNYLAGAVTHIGNVPRGLQDYARVGDEIRAKSLHVRGKVYSLTPSDVTFRIIVFQDMQQTVSTIPNVTQLLTADSTVAMWNRDYDRRWRVLKEHTVTLNASFLNGDVAQDFEWHLPMGDVRMAWTAADGIEARGLYMLITADVAEAAGPLSKPAIGDVGTTIRSELSFYDD